MLVKSTCFRTKQQIVAWSNCASHEPKIKPAKRRVDNVLYQVRLPHFVKTSCGTPSRELFRFGLPAHRHRREGWLTIVNELRTTHYEDIMNIAAEFEKLNKTTNVLYFDDN